MRIGDYSERTESQKEFLKVQRPCTFNRYHFLTEQLGGGEKA